MPRRPALSLAALAGFAVISLAAGTAAAQTAGSGLPSSGNAAVDQVIDVYAAIETAWRADRRCHLLATPERRKLDWLEANLERVARTTFKVDTRDRIGGLAAKTSKNPPFAACDDATRTAITRVMPTAELLVRSLTGQRYAGDETYRRFLADIYVEARASLAVDAHCRGSAEKIAVDPAMRGALAKAAAELTPVLGAKHVGRLDSEAATAAKDGQCGPWLGQAVVDAGELLDRLSSGLARDAAAAAGGGSAAAK